MASPDATSPTNGSSSTGGSSSDGASREENSAPEDAKQSSSGSSPSESPLLGRSRSTSGSTGEGVDRKIEKSLVTPKRVAIVALAVLLVGALAYGVWTTATSGSVYNVDRERVTVSTVTEGDFQEFIAVSGSVIPEQIVYLDAVEGGRIEEIYIEEGEQVEEGQRILRLSNNDLRLRMLDSEASLAEQQSRMEQLKIQMQQQSLDLQQQLAQMEHQIRRLERQFERQQRLHEQDLIAEEEYLNTRDELEYQQRRLRLTQAAYEQDSLAQQSRLAQMEETSKRLERSYGAMQEAIENLTIRAPIKGQLTALNAELGQIINAGARVGQVDKVDTYKLRAQIDEFYIERVQHGQTATTQSIGDSSYTLEVDRVYPEVENGRFEVDLAFTGASPSALRRGQSVRLRLELGQPQTATLLPRGGFYQSTGGNWAYVVTEDGGEAVRRPIRLGRQNPNHFEVLEGLEPGDEVITSSYDTFGEADRLSLE